MQNVNYSKPLDLKIFSSFLNSLQLIKKNSTVAVSVSAGVDSMALLHMSDKWAKENNIRLLIIIFNHNIREESLREVSYVRKTAKKLGWRFKTLIWKSPAKKIFLKKLELLDIQQSQIYAKKIK